MSGGLHHVDLNVSDLKAADAFWGWFLELLDWKKFDSWPKGVGYKLGETYIDFIQVETPFAGDSYHRGRVGLNHLAFHAKSRAHVDEITLALKARGIKILYEDRHPFAGGPDYYAVYFEDPVDRIKGEVAAPAL